MVAKKWQDVAKLFKQGSKMEDPTALLKQTTAPLLEIADLEDAVWRSLRQAI
jgi:hypothetical protein